MSDIREYFNLAKTIESIKDRRKVSVIYNATLHTHTTVIDGEAVVLSFNLDNVLTEADGCLMLDKTIEEHEQRMKYFNRYLHSLTKRERAELFSKYLHQTSDNISKELEQQTLEEIEQIETAICYMFGYPIPIESEELQEIPQTERIDMLAKLLGGG